MNADTALAAVILLDQGSRCMWRDDPRTYAGDELALQVVKKSKCTPFMTCDS